MLKNIVLVASCYFCCNIMANDISDDMDDYDYNRCLQYIELVSEVEKLKEESKKLEQDVKISDQKCASLEQENDKRAQEIKQLYYEYQEEVKRQNEAKCQQIRQAQQEVIAWVAATEKALRDDEKTIAAVNEENIKLEEAKKTL